MSRHLPEFASPEEIKAIESGGSNANCGAAIPHAPHSWNSGPPEHSKWWCDGSNRAGRH